MATRPLNIRIDEDELAALQCEAKQRGVPLSRHVRDTLLKRGVSREAVSHEVLSGIEALKRASAQ